jgi:hypothetical protein
MAFLANKWDRMGQIALSCLLCLFINALLRKHGLNGTNDLSCLLCLFINGGEWDKIPIVYTIPSAFEGGFSSI